VLGVQRDLTTSVTYILHRKNNTNLHFLNSLYKKWSKVYARIFDSALWKNKLFLMAQKTSKESLLRKYYNGFITTAYL
jgi:hypothetical protein